MDEYGEVIKVFAVILVAVDAFVGNWDCTWDKMKCRVQRTSACDCQSGRGLHDLLACEIIPKLSHPVKTMELVHLDMLPDAMGMSPFRTPPIPSALKLLAVEGFVFSATVAVPIVLVSAQKRMMAANQASGAISGIYNPLCAVTKLFSITNFSQEFLGPRFKSCHNPLFPRHQSCFVRDITSHVGCVGVYSAMEWMETISFSCWCIV